MTTQRALPFVCLDAPTDVIYIRRSEVAAIGEVRILDHPSRMPVRTLTLKNGVVMEIQDNAHNFVQLGVIR